MESYEVLSADYETRFQELLAKYGNIVQEQIQIVFQKLPVSNELSNCLMRMCVNLFCKSIFPSVSGVVIAGYGEKEIFPSVISYLFEAVVDNRLMCKQDAYTQIGRDVPDAVILSFAQREMVSTFVEGIEPSYQQTLQTYIQELILGYPNNIIDAIPGLDSKRKEELLSKLKGVAEDILKDFSKQLDDYKNKHHVTPILNAVAALPKDALAEMAESLFELASDLSKVLSEN